MKTTVKVVSCILSAVLFLYLMVWDYPRYKNKLNSESIVGAESLSVEGGEAAGDSVNQKEPEAQIEELKKQQTAAGSTIYLYFDQVFESCYDQLYPLMKEMGYTGTMVLMDGQLPGDYLQMTETQCKEMLDDGWELAVGGSEDIDLTADFADVESEWRAYLENYLAEIKMRLNIVPTIYCFNEGEYREEYDEILKEYGFKTIRYFGDEILQGKQNGLNRIRAYRVVQNTDIDNAVDELSTYSVTALCTRRVAEEIQPDSDNMEIGKYREFLDSIEETDGMYIAGNSEAQ